MRKRESECDGTNVHQIEGEREKYCVYQNEREPEYVCERDRDREREREMPKDVCVCLSFMKSESLE